MSELKPFSDPMLEEESTPPAPRWPRIPLVGGLLSIVPGLGQAYAGYFTRGFLLFFFIVSLVALAYWRVDDAGAIESAQLFPPMLDLVEETNQLQRQAMGYAFIAMLLTAVAYLWNIYDGFSAAAGRPAPARLAMVFITLPTLIIGAHITELDIGKAISEIDDVGPRLAQIMWPWDNITYYETDNIEGTANWSVPCGEDPEPIESDDDEPFITITPDCGVGSGERRPDGTRDEGTLVQITGSNFEPNEAAEVVVKAGSSREFRVVEGGSRLQITPDDDGNVDASFVMPNLQIPPTAVGTTNVLITLRQQREVGSPKLTEDFQLAFEGIIVTLFLALMATAAGVVLAVPVSFLAARNLMTINSFTKTVYYVVRLVLNVIRSIEPLVWALIAIIWVGPGPFAGVIALTIHTIASLGKLYSESIESIDPGPIEALQATGADRLQTIIYAVVPQVIPPFVSFTIYRWDINVRMSTIIGAVGGGGIGVVLFQWIRLADYDAVGIAVWMIAIVVTILDYASARIRENYV